MPKKFDVKASYDQFLGKNTIYSFFGKISSQRLDKILSSAEKKLTDEKMPLSIQKRIYNILVEGLQNIFHYQSNKTINALMSQDAFVLINDHDREIKITLGNYMFREDAEGVQSRLKLINDLSKEELKELYRGVLDIGGQSDLGGAGLGFIDMAKRTSNRLKSKFYPVNPSLVFFTLDLEVKY